MTESTIPRPRLLFIKLFQFDHPLVRVLGTTTTGIFLMHYIMIALVKRGLLGYKLSAFHPNPYIGVPTTSLIVFFLSALITWLLLRVPVLCRIVS